MKKAAPRPFSGSGDHFRTHGIEHDISRTLQEIILLLAEDRLISTLKDVTDNAVPPVEVLRIRTVQMPHPTVKATVNGLHHKVVVIRHLTVG